MAKMILVVCFIHTTPREDFAHTGWSDEDETLPARSSRNPMMHDPN